MRRILIFILAVLLPAALVSLPTSASAASAPKVTSFSATSGPLAKTTKVTLKGARLNTVSKARVGRAKAKISSKKKSSLVLTVPARRTSGTQKVQLYAKKKWRTVGTWRYVAKPSISGLSKTTGQLLGGESVVVKGKALDRVSRVVISGTAAKITARKATSLTFTTPVSVPGATTIQVSSPGGSASRPFTYVAPAPSAKATIKTVASTFEAAPDDIQWVTASEDEGYVVSLAPGSSIPEVGDPFYLAAGSRAYASGLAGKVESLAAQADGSIRVVVKSVPLEDIFTQLDVDVTQRVDPSSFESAPRPEGRARAAAAPSGSLGKATRSAFECESSSLSDGFEGALEITVSDLTPHFESKGFGNPFKENEVISYISGKTEVSGSLTAESAMECNLKPSWQNSHRKVVHLGYGVTYSIAPEVHVSISASGSVSISRSQTFLYGTHWREDGGTRKIQDAGTPQVSVQGKLAGSVSLDGGVSNRLGLLDRIGVEVEGLLYIDGEASFTAGATGTFCLQATYGLKAPVKLFLDVWVKEATETLFTIVVEFGSMGRCGQVWGGDDTDVPEITTSQLPDATVGADYNESLATSDDREGVWRTSSVLPSGLSLGSDGAVTGRPTGGIGSHTLLVTFEDSAGNTASSSVTLKVNPSTGLGGGDIQATLTWSHAADMDLHALEPDGTEIFYGNRTSPTGGELDHDSNVGCGDDTLVAENIRWPAGVAPTGAYNFAVQTYSACSVADPTWHLVVRVDGKVVVDQTGSGTSGWTTVNYGAAARSGSRAQADLPPMSTPDKD